ncbi:hypothetical protein FOC1_g10000703 [Fusarium oxysporum f. sp. cubense race 1]|uniref:Uncharacterized protein n=2 Tax=Fusarium oxysporum f. sp. cubense TaxID=61366 RepID=N4U5Y5_FUSC1|nr:hypothetical protein FOC1_g10000703 [Fusarium oxysporum f. sp. cubense race 1]
MSITHISKTEFLSFFYAAFRATMTEKDIKGGIEDAGLIPFDPESVVSKLEVQLRTPTPAEEQASQAQPWTSKAPKSIREIEFQTEYLERRLTTKGQKQMTLVLKQKLNTCQCSFCWLAEP